MSSRPELLGFALALFMATPLPVIAQMTIVNPVLAAKAGAPIAWLVITVTLADT